MATGQLSRRSNRTAEEKQAARERHEERIEDALRELETVEGMAAYLVAGDIHGWNMSPGNLALVALQAPGQEVGRYGYWTQLCPVRKGVTANVWLTGGRGLPVANWSSDRVGYVSAGSVKPDPAYCERLAASWRDWSDHTVSGLRGWHEDIEPTLVADPSGVEYQVPTSTSTDTAIPF